MLAKITIKRTAVHSDCGSFAAIKLFFQAVDDFKGVTCNEEFLIGWDNPNLNFGVRRRNLALMAVKLGVFGKVELNAEKFKTCLL